MSISINKITENDLASVIKMMRDFAAYENLAEYCTITEQRLHAAMFGDKCFVDGLIAFNDSEPIAYALFHPNFSSFRGECGIYLEDIYIDDDYRRHNLGEKILREIAITARVRGFERIDFQVLDWNSPAVNFYLKHGAERNDDESHFKFSGAAFETLAS